jgi:hypothetical protein
MLHAGANTDRVLVSGESPASRQGPDTWHWVAKDVSSFAGESGGGARTLALREGAIRTKDAAGALAASKLGAIRDGSSWGRLKILGNPAVQLADLIEIDGAERPELNGSFKVVSVRHVLSKKDGYLTHVGLGPYGGSGQSGGSLAGLA